MSITKRVHYQVFQSTWLADGDMYLEYETLEYRKPSGNYCMQCEDDIVDLDRIDSTRVELLILLLQI